MKNLYDLVGTKVGFLGTNALFFRKDGATLLIDPYFSRPAGVLGPGALTRHFSPDRERIAATLDKYGITDADALLLTHSHIDHAMDVAEVSLLTDAHIYGSESTANIARGGGVPEERIHVIDPVKDYRLSPFTFSFHRSTHLPIPAPLGRFLEHNDIEEPLTPPARVFDYKEGGVYAIRISTSEWSAALIGSAGILPDTLAVTNVDYIFASIGGIQTRPLSYTDSYIDNVLLSLSPRRIYLTHWDLFTRPLTHPLHPLPLMERVIHRFQKRLGDMVEVMELCG